MFDDVQDFIGFPLEPKLSEDIINSYIERAMSQIERRTRHAWRSRTVRSERHRIELSGTWAQAQPVFLHNRSIKQFDKDEGDSWQVWNGSIWEEWLDTKTELNDYMVEYSIGRVNIRPFIYYPLRFMNLLNYIPMEFTYRFGEDIDEVPGDIAEACIKIVALKIVETAEFQAVMPDATDRVDLKSKSSTWRQDIEQILSNRADVLVF